MRKILMFLLLIPALVFCQTKNVAYVLRLVPRLDRIAELEKGISDHATKFHGTANKWRIFQILTGPDAGGYQIVEGPYSWEDLDNRKLTDEHNADFRKIVAPYAQKYETGYYSYREDLSSVALNDYADKIAITHVFPKIGRGPAIEANLKSAQKVYQDGNESVAVYESSSSGPAQFSIVTRYKQGFKEREMGFRPLFRDRYNKIYGEGSFDKLLEARAANTESVWSELLVSRPKLSPK